MTETRRLVIEPGQGGVPHVRSEKIVRWQFVGAAEAEPSPEEARDDLMFALRDAGAGPEPVLSFGTDGETDPRLDWPDLGTHALDPDYARLLTFASLPLGRVVPELDATPEPDPEAEAEIERQVQEDRAEWARLTALIETVAPMFRVAEARKRRTRRARAQPPKAEPSPRIIFDGERDENGWHWTRFVPGPRLARARIRPRRDGP